MKHPSPKKSLQSLAIGLRLLAAGAAPLAFAEDAPIPGVESKVVGSVEVASACQPFTMTDADRELSAKVMDGLRADDKLRGRIAVTVLNGQVLLYGTVDSVPMIYRAVETSRKITGNYRVNADGLERG